MANRLAIRGAAAAAAVLLCLGGIPAQPVLPAASPAAASASVAAASGTLPSTVPASPAAVAGVLAGVREAAAPARRPPGSARSLGVLVNKVRPLRPATYVPRLAAIEGTSFRLRPEAAAAYRKMAAAARRDGIRFEVVSAYRSHARQKQLFARYVRLYGMAQASRISARPGRSEHQTGLALDLGAASGRGRLAGSFASTRESRWLVRNAHKHGFILRYPRGQEKTTGYAFEPWHYRYVGRAIAQDMRDRRAKTLEAYYFGP